MTQLVGGTMFSIIRISILFYFLSALIAQPGTYALQFDDEFDYVNIGRPLSSESNDNITISSWLNTTESDYIDNVGTFISNDTQPSNPQINFSIKNSGQIELHGEGFWCLSDTSINDGQWHHVVGTKSGGTLTLYIDCLLYTSPSPRAKA